MTAATEPELSAAPPSPTGSPTAMLTMTTSVTDSGTALDTAPDVNHNLTVVATGNNINKRTRNDNSRFSSR